LRTSLPLDDWHIVPLAMMQEKTLQFTVVKRVDIPLLAVSLVCSNQRQKHGS
jgi:hypothetical protein